MPPSPAAGPSRIRARVLAAALALAPPLAAPPAAGFFADPSVKQTLGSGRYSSTKVAVDFGADWHLKPAFSAYRSDSSSGTFKTYSLRLAYDGKLYGFGASAGFTPAVNGYRSHFGGIDASMTFEKGAATFDLGAGFTRVVHEDEFSQVVLPNGRVVTLPRPAAVEIIQSDLSGAAGVSYGWVRLDVDVVKSAYNQDLAKISARSALLAALPGLESVIQGFPDVSVASRIELPRVPRVSPYVSYTYTKFKVLLPHSAAYVVGGLCRWGRVDLDASYERYAQGGSRDINYYGLSATVRF